MEEVQGDKAIDWVTRIFSWRNYGERGSIFCRIGAIRSNLESGERDLSIGDIGFRVNDRKMRFRLGLRISKSVFSKMEFEGRSSIHNVAAIFEF